MAFKGWGELWWQGLRNEARSVVVEISVTRAPGSRWVIGQWSAPVSQSSARDEREEEVLEPGPFLTNALILQLT